MTDQEPWYSTLPTPKISPELITVEELGDLIAKGSKAGKDLVVVDVRRNDLEVSSQQLIGRSLSFFSIQNQDDQQMIAYFPAFFSMPTAFQDDMIPHAINLPAQSFHASLPVVRQILDSIPLAIFHCTKSNGRGPRTAGWYADYLVSKGESPDKVKVLKGGIVAWRERFPVNKIY